MTMTEADKVLSALHSLTEKQSIKGPLRLKLARIKRALVPELREYAEALDDLLKEYGEPRVSVSSFELLEGYAPTRTANEGGRTQFGYELTEEECRRLIEEGRELSQESRHFLVPVHKIAEYQTKRRELEEAELDVDLPTVSEEELSDVEWPPGTPDEIVLIVT